MNLSVNFKYKSNYDNSYGGDFSHVYVIMHQYFGKKLQMQKMSI
jgi:hypothetical protein